MPPNQRQQPVEGLWRERDSLAILQQEVFLGIEAERAEFLDKVRFPTLDERVRLNKWLCPRLGRSTILTAGGSN
jgi:hypothetical protein